MQVLLFSNSVRLLRILQSVLDARAYDYLMLDGSVAQQVTAYMFGPVVLL